MEQLSNCCNIKHPTITLVYRRRFSHHSRRIHHHQLSLFQRRKILPVVRLSSTLPLPNNSTQPSLSHELLAETLKTLEWDKLCGHLSTFASTAMARSAALVAEVPMGRTQEESQRLLDQTTAALSLPEQLDFSGIHDVTAIVDSTASGEVMTIRQLCVVKRTLMAAQKVMKQLKAVPSDSNFPERYNPLIQILENCKFLAELVQHIEYCVDCNLSVILDRASEKLKTIRSERKKNMEKLNNLLDAISNQVFQAGGIDRPLVTNRRSRMCVGIRASHKSLLQGGVILNASGSGTTYFMEPREAVDLNNKEVRLVNAEKDEEQAILSLLSAEIAASEAEIKYMLARVQELDLAVARAGYAKWISGVCPILNPICSEGTLSVDIDGIKHPLLLASALSSLPDGLIGKETGPTDYDGKTNGKPDLPVPIDIKIGHGTNVVIISGPNAGGKTASMKTLALASLMTKAGMYLPACGYPKLPWFDLVLADIGDHQSLEENLSTFSGHMLRICTIMEVASKDSLVLIDEIGSGTDPSEGVALSASILEYLKDRVSLAVVTTHYADLSRLRDKDARFENAAMEFCLETLKPSYQILWGRTGESNALKIARNVGFDMKVIENAMQWMKRLVPEKQQERRGLLYQSLLEERRKLFAEKNRASSLHSEIMNLYHEIHIEAEDLGLREKALLENARLTIQEELETAKSQLETATKDFENQLQTANVKHFSSLVKKADLRINSIVSNHNHDVHFTVEKGNDSSYIPLPGELVHVKNLGDRLATILEVSEDDGSVLVQSGKIRIRVDRSSIRSAIKEGRPVNSLPRMKKQGERLRNLKDLGGRRDVEGSYGAAIQTSTNTVDLRGMRAEEASDVLNMEILGRESQSVLYVIHGMGSGVIKERVIEILSNHWRVVKFEQDNPMNYGCTVAYIK
ncbi:hypothetical protein V2J09_004140 [Rumex salicifolius]